MTRLKIILRSNYFYLFLIFISLFETIYFTKIKEYRSVYNGDEENFLGVIKNINIDDKCLLYIRHDDKVFSLYNS